MIDPITHAIVNSGLGEWGVLALLILLLMTVGMFLDGISIFLIFVPLLMPIANAYGWDPVWFGVILTLKVALGQFTLPLAVNLMVSCRIARVPMESTVPWWCGCWARCSWCWWRCWCSRNWRCGCRKAGILNAGAPRAGLDRYGHHNEKRGDAR